jgi:predicted phosphodiesterase
VTNGEAAEVWGLISDVHGNLAALDVAIEALGEAGARRLAFLGDYLGRGDSEGCVRRIKEVADIAIVGNRDLDWQDRVSPASKAFVQRLPRTAQTDGLLVSHGDPRLTPGLSTAEIAHGFARAWPELERRRAQIWAFGHSHHARIWRKDEPRALPATCVSIEDNATYALNVGTAGLPFPGKGGPSVALVDFVRGEIRQISLRRV